MKASLILIAAMACFVESFTLRKLGQFHLRYPAFTNIYTNRSAISPLDKYNLLLTTFAAPGLFTGTTDTVQLVKGVGRYMQNIGSIKPEMLTSRVTWPNEVAFVPDSLFPKDLVVIPDGFLVPFKTKGAIKFMDITNGAKNGPYTVSSSSDGSWFYHRVNWHDMDGDGDQDIVTCRAREPVLFGQEDEELIWLENPGGNFQTTWNTHVLAHGPDSFFRFTQLKTSAGMVNCIIAAQFFTKSLSVYWTTQANGLFTDASMIRKRVIDDTIGSVFEVDIVDLNKDGRLDLLVTTNGANGTLLAYEVPDDFRTGTFVKHTIAVGFIPRQSGVGKGAPGSALVVHPNENDKSKRPTILLSGDDDGRAYTFTANSESPSDWTYTQTTFCDAGRGTVGELAAADVDGDGYLEVFVPSYSTNEVFVYGFAPQTDSATGLIG